MTAANNVPQDKNPPNPTDSEELLRVRFDVEFVARDALVAGEFGFEVTASIDDEQIACLRFPLGGPVQRDGGCTSVEGVRLALGTAQLYIEAMMREKLATQLAQTQQKDI